MKEQEQKKMENAARQEDEQKRAHEAAKLQAEQALARQTWIRDNVVTKAKSFINLK